MDTTTSGGAGSRVMQTAFGMYHYYLKDHLGNVYVTFDSNGSVKQEDSYYPFGLTIKALHSGGSDNKNLYNGKELQDEFGFGMYDYGFRFYDPLICRFIGIDPISEKYNFVTPYNYAENSPIANIDLWGLQAYYAADGSFLHYKEGGITGDKAPVILLSNENNTEESGDTETPLTFRGESVTNFEFEQYSAIIHNETYGAAEGDKLQIADAIFNKRDNLTKDYPGIKNPTLQKCLDKVAYGNDSHEQRMSDKRANPASTDVIPGTITKNNPKGLKLSLITEKNYQNYFKTDIKKRTGDMQKSNKVVTKALLRDNGKRKEDTANGKSHWTGDGKKNKLY